MEIKFYLNDQKVDVEVAPVITETLDETLDSASVILKANNQKEPYAPMQSFVIEIDNEKLYYYTTGDVVSVFSENPLTYKHSISLVQNTKLLSKYIVRNSTFSQQATTYKRSIYGLTESLGTPGSPGTEDVFAEFSNSATNKHSGRGVGKTIKLVDKERIKSANIKMIFNAGIAKSEDAEHPTITRIKNIDDLKSRIGTKSANELKWGGTLTTEGLFIGYVLNGETKYKKAFSWSNDFQFETPYDVKEIINELYEQGAREFFAIVDDPSSSYYSPDVILGVQYPEHETHISFGIFTLYLEMETYLYTAWDILELLQKRQQQITNGESKYESLFEMPQENSELGQLLKNTIAPNITYTQCSMYECVAEIFRLFDAVFTINGETKELGIEYLNEQDRTNLKTDFSGVNISISEDKYNNGMITYYQDARIKELYPTNEKILAPIKSAELGVPDQADHNMILPHAIDHIIKVELLIPNSKFPREYPNEGYASGQYYVNDLIIDITDYIFEESLWTSLDTGDDPTSGDNWLTNYRQSNTIYYAKGDNKIQVAYSYKSTWGATNYAFENAAYKALRLMSGWLDSSQPSTSAPNGIVITTDLTDWKNVRWRCEYLTTINGRTKIESITNKFNGDMLVNQSNGAIDLNKMGLNMLGTTIKLGEPTLNAVQKITNWSDRVKKGSIIIDNGERWVANVCSYTLLDNNHIQANISFIKNFNALSLRIKLNQEKRMTNISSELIQKSEDNYIEYIYYSSQPFEELVNDQIAPTFNLLCNGILATFTNTANEPFTPAMATFEYNNKETYIPLAKYGAGNCLCFEMAYSSAMEAGRKTTTKSGWFGSNKYFTESIFYTTITDDNSLGGFADIVSIRLYNNMENTESITFDFTNIPELWHRNYNQAFDELLDTYKVAELKNFEIYKQPNEIFALNYELCFLPQETRKHIDFIGNKFINENALVSSEKNSKQLYIAYTTNDKSFQYSILDTKVDDNSTKVALKNIECRTITNHKKTTSVAVSDWFKIGGETQQPIVLINMLPTIKGDAYVGTYEVPVGDSLKGKTLANYSISESPVSGYTNSVSFDSTTGKFTGTIYSLTTRGAATITYVVKGKESAYWVTSGTLIDTAFKEMNIYDLAISGSSENKVAFDKSTGTFTYSIKETTEPTEAKIYTISFYTIYEDIIEIAFTTESTIYPKTWAICDNDNNIYFASNDDSDMEKGTTTKTIYFRTSKNRV